MNVKYNVCIQFFREMAENESMTWIVSENIIEINYYYYETNLTNLFGKLNEIAINFGLSVSSWKLSPCMCLSRPLPRITDFSATDDFSLRKWNRKKQKYASVQQTVTIVEKNVFESSKSSLAKKKSILL